MIYAFEVSSLHLEEKDVDIDYENVTYYSLSSILNLYRICVNSLNVPDMNETNCQKTWKCNASSRSD